MRQSERRGSYLRSRSECSNAAKSESNFAVKKLMQVKEINGAVRED